MKSLSIPWGKLPPFVAWVALVAAMACIMHAGLGYLSIPGLEQDSVRWALAVALAVAETLLLEAFRRSGNQFYVIAAVLTLGASLGIEFLNLSNAARRAKVSGEMASGSLQAAQEDRDRLREEVRAVDGRIEQLRASVAVWGRDGDPTNDAALPAALERRALLISDLARSQQRVEELSSARSGAVAQTSAVADVSPWALLAGLAALKVGIMALGWAVGERTKPRQKDPPGGGGRNEKPAPPELPGSGAPVSIPSRTTAKAARRPSPLRSIARQSIQARMAA